MGQCRSRDAEPIHERDHTAKKPDTIKRRHVGKSTTKASSKMPKMIVINPDGVEPSMADRRSPSEATLTTRPATPLSPMETAAASSSSGSEKKNLVAMFASLSKGGSMTSELVDIDDQDEGVRISGDIEFDEVPSLRHTEGLDQVIPEEVDPDAPSDEEESYHKDTFHPLKGPLPGSGAASTTSSNLKMTSPPRPQTAVKMRHKRVTRPDSIIYHDPPLVVPPFGQAPTDGSSSPPGSVDRQTVANFNKLKVQVKLAAQQQKARRRAAKLEDRYEDVAEYKKLWTDFENIQSTVRETPSKPRLKRSRSFDLKNSKSWYFDFQSLEGSEDDDETKSQSSLSLLSAASMESQRRLFAEKIRARQQKSEASSVGVIEDLPMTLERFIGLSPSFDWDTNDGCSAPGGVEASSRSEGKRSSNSIQRALSSPRTFFRRKREEDATGAFPSPENGSPLSPPKLGNDGISRASQDQDHPSGPRDGPASVENSNDYMVSRRRRQYSYEHDGSAAAASERSLADSLGVSHPNVRHPESIPRQEHNLASKGEDGVRWRNFGGMKEKVVKGIADKCLADVEASRATIETSEQPKSPSRISRSPADGISFMSTEQFLRISDHALVRISRIPGEDDHVVQAKRLDFDAAMEDVDSRANKGEEKKAEEIHEKSGDHMDIADEVSNQVDEILRRFRQNLQESPHR